MVRVVCDLMHPTIARMANRQLQAESSPDQIQVMACKSLCQHLRMHFTPLCCRMQGSGNQQQHFLYRSCQLLSQAILKFLPV